MADTDLLKDIPGYKAILKSVLKSQIQLLLEQLSNQAGEESIILTASVTDGALSHLGSSTGKGFLEGRDEVKTQFLGYCLKSHHKKQANPSESTSHPSSLSSHPETSQYRPQPTIRHPRPGPYQRSSNFRQSEAYPSLPLKVGAYQSPAYQSPNTHTQGSVSVPSTFSSNTIQTSTFANIRSEATIVKQEQCEDGVGDNSNNSSAGAQGYTDNDPLNSQFAENGSNSAEKRLGDASEHSESGTLDSGQIKVEAISPDELDLEITGIEPGNVSWENPDQKMDMDNSGHLADQFTHDATHSQDAIHTQDAFIMHYAISTQDAMNTQDAINTQNATKSREKDGCCRFCGKFIGRSSWLVRHERKHTGERPFKCPVCSKQFSAKHYLKIHILSSHNDSAENP